MNPEYSMHNDTASYYLTWDNSVNSNVIERIQNGFDQSALPKDLYYLNTRLDVFQKFLSKGVGYGNAQKVSTI